MLGIDKRIEKLGVALSDAFTDRAKHYFAKAAGQDGQTRINHNLVGAVLGEISQVILHVTRRESTDSE